MLIIGDKLKMEAHSSQIIRRADNLQISKNTTEKFFSLGNTSKYLGSTSLAMGQFVSCLANRLSFESDHSKANILSNPVESGKQWPMPAYVYIGDEFDHSDTNLRFNISLAVRKYRRPVNAGYMRYACSMGSMPTNRLPADRKISYLSQVQRYNSLESDNYTQIDQAMSMNFSNILDSFNIDPQVFLNDPDFFKNMMQLMTNLGNQEAANIDRCKTNNLQSLIQFGMNLHKKCTIQLFTRKNTKNDEIAMQSMYDITDCTERTK